MNNYIFLTDEGYTFQPETEQEPVEIDTLEVIGTASGTDANHAYRNLLAQNPDLDPASFTRIFCYQLGEDVEGNEGSENYGHRIKQK
jgi:hypothetical protein